VSKTLLSALAVGLLLTTPWTTRAADEAKSASQPLVVVTLSGYDEIIGDLRYLGKLGGDDELANDAESALKGQLGVDDLKGLDKKRPWGFVFQSAPDNQYSWNVLLPVTDIKALLDSLQQIFGQAGEPKDGVYELTMGAKSFFVKEKNGWAVVADSTEKLAKLPNDPALDLGEMPKAYDLGIRLVIKNIPAQTRQLLQMYLQLGFQAGMRQNEGESDEQYRLRMKMAQQAMQQFNEMFNDLDTLEIGLSVDPKQAVGRLEYVITALPGTKTAQQMVVPTDLKTQFAGVLLPGAAVTLTAAGQIPQTQAAQIQSALAERKGEALRQLESQGLEGEQLAQAKRLVSELIDVLSATVESGRMDVGMSAMAGPKTLSVVAGGYVADAQRLDKVLRDVAVQIGKDEPEAAKMIKLDVEKHEGVQLHMVSIPKDKLEGMDQLTALVGDSLDFVVGVGEKQIYLGAGRDALATVKKAIDGVKAQPAKATLPAEVVIRLTPIAELIAAIAERDNVKDAATKVLVELKKSPEKDKLIITSTPVPQGGRVRIEFQEGILRLIGGARQMAK
jgi:hypothetical protein